MTDLLPALRRLKVETGSLACLGCGHEHNCGTQGCAILGAAITALETRPEVVRCRECSRRYAKDFGQYCPSRVGPVSPDGYCDGGQRRKEEAVGNV